MTKTTTYYAKALALTLLWMAALLLPITTRELLTEWLPPALGFGGLLGAGMITALLFRKAVTRKWGWRFWATALLAPLTGAAVFGLAMGLAAAGPTLGALTVAGYGLVVTATLMYLVLPMGALCTWVLAED